jgi:hypothetical protein
MEAETIGPIPNVIIEPKLPANTALNCANWSTAFGLSPKRGIFVRMKYNIRIIPVHLSFSLN